MSLFDILNGPTYSYLVKNFWVRVKVYDEGDVALEECQKIVGNEDFKGKFMIIPKKDVMQPAVGLRIRIFKTAFIDDLPYNSKLENPEVIQEYINMAKEEAGVIITINDIPGAPEGSAYKPPRKRKQNASKTMKEVHKPPKKKIVH
ncbi:unnamed protein product [Vicia faba]|uniref:Uncharacterized protein n=1 Tax=Vicia faba TaxID=3906 RepID=A0AAV1AB33_VICFA|nr:unnamed protein product [Vicia faba]